MKVYCFSEWEEQSFVVAEDKESALKAYTERKHGKYVAVREDEGGDPRERKYLFSLYESEAKSRVLGCGIRVYEYNFELGRVYP